MFPNGTTPVVQTYWDDLNEGDSVPGFQLELTQKKVVEQVSGSQDFYGVHHDREFALAGGHKEIFFNTRFTRACFGRLLADLAGTEGWVRRLEYAMRRPNNLGDTIRITGKVTRKYMSEEGEALVDLDLAIENDREGGVTTPASGTVMLPIRQK